MRQAIVKLSSKNQVVLPRQVREALGVQAGDSIVFVVEDHQVRLYAQPQDLAHYTLGLGKEVWQRLGGGEAYLREERGSWHSKRD